MDQLDQRGVQEAIHVVAVAGVAAEETVIAQEPQVPAVCLRRLRRLGDEVWIGQPVYGRPAQELGKLLFAKPQQVEVELECLQIGQFNGQQVRIPGGRR